MEVGISQNKSARKDAETQRKAKANYSDKIIKALDNHFDPNYFVTKKSLRNLCGFA